MLFPAGAIQLFISNKIEVQILLRIHCRVYSRANILLSVENLVPAAATDIYIWLRMDEAKTEHWNKQQLLTSTLFWRKLDACYSHGWINFKTKPIRRNTHTNFMTFVQLTTHQMYWIVWRLLNWYEKSLKTTEKIESLQ